LRKAYKGESIDIFAAGVILFVMVAQHPPFSMAVAKDPFYKFIGGGRPDLFWKKMMSNKRAGFFSDDFKNLVQRMLAYKERITMDEILNHPWMNGPVPSKMNLIDEFKTR